MQTPLPLLQNVRVAKPCPASWSGMESVDGDRVRHCDGCKKNVYNLSAMTQAEAEGLLRKHEGRLCVRYFQRRDGTVLTADCPVGVQAVRQMFIQRSVATAALFLLGFAAMAVSSRSTVMGGMPGPEVRCEDEATVGKLAMPVAPTTPERETPVEVKGQAKIEPSHTMGEPMMGAVAFPDQTELKRQRESKLGTGSGSEKPHSDEQNNH